MGMTDDFDFIAPLFVPGIRPERFAKAAASGADAIIIDLEDAVPANAKAEARSALRADFTGLPVLVRINGAGTDWHTDDLQAASGLPFAGIVLPKAEMGVALENLCSSIRMPVIALVETARGLVDARNIAALPGVARLAFGSIDFCADLGCEHSREALLSTRCEMVVASRLGGKPAPIDGVTTAIDDAEAVTGDARHARMLGFGGKLCIHPKQVSPVMTAFQPGESEIAWAHKVLASGDGAVAVDGAMVDEPVRIRARAILKRSA
jgi:citrate lyase subunit beta/citryl-CoA lyase